MRRRAGPGACARYRRLGCAAVRGPHRREAPRTTQRGGQLNVKFEHDGGAFRVRGEGRVRWNDAYRGGVYSREARDAYVRSADWRELYIAGEAAGWNLSAGLQQVVWGKADNLRVVDMVNPVDLRDFILPELNDYRKPVPMVRGTRAVGDWQLELLYLPRFVPTRYARPGSEFDLAQPDPELLASVQLLPEQRPSKSFRGGELGMQVSRSFGALDLSGYLFHTWDDNPVYRFLPAQDGAGQPAVGLQPAYRRQSMAGLSLAHAMGNGLVLRSELAYVPNFTYMVAAGSEDGLARSATLTGLLGLDYVWRDWLLSAQVTDRHIDAWDRSYLLRKHDPMVTLAATGTAMAGKLDSRLSLARFAGTGGYVAQARGTWKPDDSWAYTAGVDVFGGDPAGIFGRFRNKDRLWFELKYHF
uniref:Alginate export domain-containing protein n=1 Tax=uncultured bacterium pEAF66 TaxID=480414 RepID=B0LFU5_9BACT|nr:hypothetical protein [uncultured bacterium pEAF66]